MQTEPLTKFVNAPETFEQAMQVISREELDELDALGDSRDDTRWLIGFKAVKYIDDWGWPAMVAYQLIASRSDYRTTSVRAYCRVARYWTSTPVLSDIRDEMNYLRFSIFAHAMRTETPIRCLEYAATHGLRRPGELMELFPAVVEDPEDPDQDDPPKMVMPLWARPVQRRIDDIQDPYKKRVASNIYSRLVNKLQDLGR